MQDIVIRAVCYSLLHSLWQGLLLAVAAAMLMMFTKKAVSASRYKLLCSLLIIFLAGVCFTFLQQVGNAVHPSVAATIASSTGNHSTTVTTPSGNLIFTSRVQQLTGSCKVYLNRYAWVLVLIWFVAFLYHFVQLLLGMVNAERMRYYKTSIVSEEWDERLLELSARLRITKPVLLMESALLKVPVLIGYLKPVILIPAGMLSQLSPEQVEAILLHELAHIKRHDYLVNLIQHAITTIFFFNPGVLWISSLIREERENCCDDIAIIETKSRKQFVEALVSFNQYSNTVGNNYALSWITGKSQLLQRVQRIVTKQINNLHSGELIILLSVLLFSGSAFITLRHAKAPLVQISKPVAAKPVQEIKRITVQQAEPTVSVNQITKAKAIKKLISVNVAVPPPPAPVPEPVEVELPDPQPVEMVMVNEQKDDRLATLQQQLGKLGYLENNLGRLQTLQDHGLSPEYIEGIQRAGYNNISLDFLLQLRDHGVQVSFLQGLSRLGYGHVPLEKAMNLVDHGVSLGCIESFRNVGLKNISLDEATKLRDHGVNSAFISAFKNKTGQYFSIEEYIKLKDSGINPGGDTRS